MSMSDAIRDTRDTQPSLEPILVALEHIEARGSLLLFAPDHAQRVRLMKVMTEIELVAWNAMAKKYELTPFGCQCLCRVSRDHSFVISLNDLGASAGLCFRLANAGKTGKFPLIQLVPSRPAWADAGFHQ